MHHKGDTLVEYRNATLRIRDKAVFAHTNWRIQRGEHWVVLGANGSGKTTLVRALTGVTPVVAGTLRWAPGTGIRNRVAYVGRELATNIVTEELRRGPAKNLSARGDLSITPRSLLQEGNSTIRSQLIRLFHLSGLLDNSVVQLSHGELQKVLLTRALSARPALLILDEPFDGLDPQSSGIVAKKISDLMASSTVVLVTHLKDEIPPGVQRVLFVEDCTISGSGDTTLLQNWEPPDFAGSDTAIVDNTNQGSEEPSPEIVRFTDVSVRYNGFFLFNHLNLTVRLGDNLGIAGPNGSGKTTILRLIYGDHLQAYSNDISLFGQQRGTGETVWEIKHRIGMVTPHLTPRFRNKNTVLEVVLGGFFDSIGLYRRPSRKQLTQADGWINALGLAHLKERFFVTLSSGEKTAVLIARATLKQPELLLLDEPFSGLDAIKRGVVTGVVEQVCSSRTSSVIMVTQRKEHMPASFPEILDLGEHK